MLIYAANQEERGIVEGRLTNPFLVIMDEIRGKNYKKDQRKTTDRTPHWVRIGCGLLMAVLLWAFCALFVEVRGLKNLFYGGAVLFVYYSVKEYIDYLMFRENKR